MSCPDCFKGCILPGVPKGSMVNGAYFAPSPSNEHSDRAVILLTDIFGLPLVNSKILADYFAEQIRCDVWVPDLFNGYPVLSPNELKFPEKAGERVGIIETIKFIFLAIPRIFRLLGLRASVLNPKVIEFNARLKAEKGYAKLGGVGYCIGGVTALRLGATDTFDTIVIAHPGPYTMKEAAEIKVPSAWICPEDDMCVPHKQRLETEAAFVARENPPLYEFKDYEGCAHGFAIRPNMGYPLVKEGYEASLVQIIEWFKKTLL